MNIAVFGAGYVGLVTAVCLSDLGFRVQVVEKDRSKLSRLQAGISTIYEPGLEEMLVRNLGEGRLIFTDDAPLAILEAEVLFVCVGTPSRPDGSADMSQIEAVTKEIVENSLDSGYKLIVVKSTVPVGTGRWIEKMSALYAKGRRVNLEIASNPEFLREGAAVKEFMHPDRIVVGAASERGRALMEDVYRSFDCPKLFTDSHTAEIIKYAANFFSRDQNLLHQHGVRPVRGDGSRRDAGGRGNRLRQADRGGFPESRTGFRRFLLSEGSPRVRARRQIVRP